MGSIRVVVNGEPRQLPGPMTVAELLAHLRVRPGRVAVEVNERVVRRAEHDHHRVEDGDRVEIVHFVGGG